MGFDEEALLEEAYDRGWQVLTATPPAAIDVHIEDLWRNHSIERQAQLIARLVHKL